MSAHFKAKLDSQDLTLGSFVFSTDPSLPEVYAAAGFDFVIIDMEHGLNDIGHAVAHMRSARGAGIHALVRVGEANLSNIPRLLDAGCEGLVIPHFGRSGSGAAAALESVRYHPSGTRPTCTGVSAARFGVANFAEYAERANHDILTVGLVEDREAVDNLEALLDRRNIDWLMPGPADLATSFGVHGQLRHPEVESAVERIFHAARRSNVPIGMYINNPEEIAPWRAKGARFFVLSIDLKWLGLSLQKAAEACRATALTGR